MPWPALAAALALVALSPLAAGAAPSDKSGGIEAIERALETEKHRSKVLDRKAQDIEKEARALSRKMVALARETRVLERRKAALGTRLGVIADLQRGKLAELERQHVKLSRLLTALQRIARNPPEAMLAYSQSAQDVLRSAMLLKSVLPQLEAQAESLRSELEEITRLHKDAAERKEALDATSAELAEKRRSLDALLARKRALARTTHDEQRRAEERMARLAAEAGNLRGLLSRIEQDRKSAGPAADAIARPEGPLASRSGETGKPPEAGAAAAAGPATAKEQQLSAMRPPKPPARARGAEAETQLALAPALRMSRARGHLLPPVVGRVVDRFGHKRPIGTRIQGVSFAADGGAQVIAPHRGLVVFAGQFRGYGRLLIIDHGEGYHTLLAGLGRIDVSVNQQLLSGEPVGIMAPSGKGPPRLYLELRRNGRPFDPLPWLAASPTDKVSG